MENYEAILSWLFSQLPMYQQKGAVAYRPDLSRMQDFCDYLGNPENKIKSVHVAGTNGKGSTSHMIASVLQESGFKVGLYTSPHLKDFRERIKINGSLISKEYIVDFVSKHKPYFLDHSLSFFEMTVGLAFCYFEESQVDVAVVEVGMGGRLDGTNLLTPEVSVITNIGLDHMQFLGNNLAEIAAEKAGIIKEGISVVIGETHPETKAVFEKVAKQLNAPISFADQEQIENHESDLKGSYQFNNIKTAVIALETLKSFEIKTYKIRQGLSKVILNTGLQGRWQVLGDAPKVIADVAHNKEGLKYVIPQISTTPHDNLHLVLGFVNDKSVAEILSLFPTTAYYYLTQPEVPRAFPLENLALIATNLKLNFQSYYSVKEALFNAKANAKPEDLIYVGGSTFVVAEIL
ncbi:bifunctional folylpolyglutamate synthase/dihydrofolate synthase [Flavobacteriaceae bacterium]|nr:bifunctional folylpolyglutamate synthase/dihydrofolate synthase [Flavobacteriaceae bacterium]